MRVYVCVEREGLCLFRERVCVCVCKGQQFNGDEDSDEFVHNNVNATSDTLTHRA